MVKKLATYLLILIALVIVTGQAGTAYAGDNAGTMLDFDGINEYVQAPLDGSSLSNWTVELWVFPESTLFKGMFSWGPTGAPTSKISALYLGDNRFGANQVDVAVGGTTNIFGDALVVPRDTWTHLAFVYEDNIGAGVNRVTVYKNGSLTGAQDNVSRVNLPNAHTLYAASGFGGQWDGKIDDIRVWQSARSQAQVEANMYLELAGNETDLLAYYRLNDGAGSNVIDETGNGHDGTMVNMETPADWLDSTVPIGAPVADSRNDLAGIWAGNPSAASGGLALTNVSFLQDVGDDVIFGHNGEAGDSSNADVPTTGDWATAPNPARWICTWFLDKTDLDTVGGALTLVFDFSDAGSAYTPSGPANNYRLLYRAGTSGSFTDIGTASTVTGDKVTFTGLLAFGPDSLIPSGPDTPNAVSNGYYTLGTLDNGASPTAITLAGGQTSGAGSLSGQLALLLLAVLPLGFGTIISLRRRAL